MADKYLVRKPEQLTKFQPYVCCSNEETAHAVATRFEREPECVGKYTWVTHGGNIPKNHWCVVADFPWMIADADEVRPGQWYIGTWAEMSKAREVLGWIFNDKKIVDTYKAGVGPIQDPGYVIVNAFEHASPVEMWCYREDLKEGECFVYLENPNDFVIVSETLVPGLPPNWCVSSSRTARTLGKNKVKRIPRWDSKPGPVILPCIDPLERLVHGMTLREIAYRYGEAQKREAVQTSPSGKHVSADDIRLDVDQFSAAPEAWALLLRQKFVDADDVERRRVVLEDQYELPNMVFVRESLDGA